jgi:SAM-dependent methyltransferase
MLHQLGSLPRRIRWALQRWNSADDRAFHDTLFGGQQYDPFTFAYPGYVTIRRFADLAEARLGNARHAVDFGCGPGEITCELARRRPDLRFTGVDHSSAAIARASAHAQRLGLANVAFVAADIATYRPDPAADIIMMFDAFHHLLDPAAFVRNARTDRFFLVEPGGDWLGGWERTLDLDWIVNALDTIRARIVWQTLAAPKLAPNRTASEGAPAAPKLAPTRAASEGGPNLASDRNASEAGGEGREPVEHRYTMDDFVHFFDGFGLTARGTIAGVEAYPPDPYGRTPLREPFGKLAYDTLVGIEDILVEQNLDLHAKHWAIYAERGASHALRTPRAINPNESAEPMRMQGPHDVEFLAFDGAPTAPPGVTLLAGVTFRNNGWRPWTSTDPDAPVFLSYHWLDRHGALVVDDGLRTPLPRSVAPGETCTMSCRIETPARKGSYVLAIDLVEEGVTWFSRAGARVLKVEFQIR